MFSMISTRFRLVIVVVWFGKEISCEVLVLHFSLENFLYFFRSYHTIQREKNWLEREKESVFCLYNTFRISDFQVRFGNFSFRIGDFVVFSTQVRPVIFFDFGLSFNNLSLDWFIFRLLGSESLLLCWLGTYPFSMRLLFLLLNKS